MKDLEKHTGITRDMRPGVRTAKLMQQNIIKKPVTKLIREQASSISSLATGNEYEEYKLPLQLSEIASESRFINKSIETPAASSNPLAQFITLTERGKEDEQLDLTAPTETKIEVI